MGLKPRSSWWLVLGLVGCQGEVDPGAADLEVVPNPIVVPRTALGQSNHVTVTLKSTGGAALAVTSIAVDGSDEWSLTALGLPALIDPQAALTVKLSYLPTGAPRPAHLVIRSNAQGTPELRVPIEAAVAAPALELCAEVAGRAELCTDTEVMVALGAVPLNQVATATVTVKSTGTIAATVESVGLLAGGDSVYAFPTVSETSILEPGARLTRVLRYQPTAAGSHRATVEVRSAVGNRRLNFEAQAEVPGALCATPNPVDFGSSVGGASQVRNFSLSACGGRPVHLSRVTVLRSAGAFTLPAAPAAQVLTPGGAALPITVRFLPAGPGSYRGTIRVESDVDVLDVPVVGVVEGNGRVACTNGGTGFSFQDYLPQRPAAVNPGPNLGPTTGVPEATCSGEPTADSGTSGRSITSVLGHNGGRWYFEVNVLQQTTGQSQAGVFAAPSYDSQIVSPFTRTAGAAHAPDAVGVVSVAADLEAGRVYFYVDGAYRSEAEMLLWPGIGAFHAGGSSRYDDQLVFNFGEAPFAYGLPTGYSAWAGGGALGGACVSDTDPAPSPANVAVLCQGGEPCPGASTYLSGAVGTPELVLLGTVETGRTSDWVWGTDGQGAPVETPAGPGHAGSALVELNRPGPLAVVLVAVDPTDWVFRVAANAEVSSVTIYGADAQTVSGLDPSVPVEVKLGVLSGVAFQWPFDIGGGDTPGTVDRLEADACLPLKIFAGAYHVRRFRVD